MALGTEQQQNPSPPYGDAPRPGDIQRALVVVNTSEDAKVRFRGFRRPTKYKKMLILRHLLASTHRPLAA